MVKWPHSAGLFSSHMLNQAIKGKKIRLAFGVTDFFFLCVTKKDKWMQIIIVKYTKTHINTINHVCMVLMYPIMIYMQKMLSCKVGQDVR